MATVEDLTTAVGTANTAVLAAATAYEAGTGPAFGSSDVQRLVRAYEDAAQALFREIFVRSDAADGQLSRT